MRNIVPDGNYDRMVKKGAIRHAADKTSMFPEWSEPYGVVDEDHLERSRIVCAYLLGWIDEEQLKWANKNMRPAMKSEHRIMYLRSPRVG